ncbi:hypothetical protein BDV93DRAFT_427035, partial [Ceratobasidium sp. AG-I]
AVRFHFYLRRQNNEHPLQENVGMQLFELEISSMDLFRESIMTGSTVELQVDTNKQYGLMLTNNTGNDLFPYILYYDPHDYSISCLYSPPGTATLAPLSELFRGVPGFPGHGGLPIGYGANGSPIHFRIPDDRSQDLGFLVLFVSTQRVDIEHITQDSPFEVTREAEVTDPIEDSYSNLNLWDTL